MICQFIWPLRTRTPAIWEPRRPGPFLCGGSDWATDLFCGWKQRLSWGEKLSEKGSVKQTTFHWRATVLNPPPPPPQLDLAMPLSALRRYESWKIRFFIWILEIWGIFHTKKERIHRWMKVWTQLCQEMIAFLCFATMITCNKAKKCSASKLSSVLKMNAEYVFFF